VLARYPELAAVVVAAAIGLTVQSPLAWLARHQGINALLAVLVLATAVTIEPAALRRIAVAWRSLAAALVTGVTVLPLLSWAASRVAPAGPLREGVLAVGLAPCEIAPVATTPMAGGEAALSAGVLIGSTLTTVIVAGPALRLEAGRSGASPAGVIAGLALVVALPLAAGIGLRARFPATARLSALAETTALASVAALVALIAAEVHLSAGYLAVGLALGTFLVGSGIAGWLLGLRSGRPVRAALLLTTSMRDFAIAAGLAAATFGTAAAAPLGLYGILVLAWGTGAAGFLRSRAARQPQGEQDGEGREPGGPPERDAERAGQVPVAGGGRRGEDDGEDGGPE
jgi:BASS family bile acid:Na+ symporter